MQNQTIEKLTARLKQIMLDTHEESFLKMAKEILEGACCDKEKQYRLLRAGELLQEGDEVFVGRKEWWKVEAGNIGDAVREKHSGQYPEGYYRRPVESEADLWKAEAERWREIAQKGESEGSIQRAFAWISEGRKVRRSGWPEGVWILRNSDGTYRSAQGLESKLAMVTMEDAACDDWELYQEPAEQTTEPEPPQGINTGYRLLNVGEKLQEGDEVYYPSGDWVVIAPGLIGFEIQPAYNFVLPAGHYRRKI